METENQIPTVSNNKKVEPQNMFGIPPVPADYQYTMAECIEYNKKRLEYADDWIKGNYGPIYESPALVLLDDPNPYNVLHDAIKQFYQMGVEHYRQDFVIEWTQKDLTKYRKKAEEAEKRTRIEEVEVQPEELKGLFQQCSAEEWAEIMGHVLDLLILSLSWDEIDEESVKGQLYYIRLIQKFFLAMHKK